MVRWPSFPRLTAAVRVATCMVSSTLPFPESRTQLGSLVGSQTSGPGNPMESQLWWGRIERTAHARPK
jgi:hypothetical protein